MPALDREFEFIIDMRKWSDERREPENKSWLDEIEVEEIAYFSKIDEESGSKIVSYSKENLFAFKEPTLNTTLIGKDYDLYCEHVECSRSWHYLKPHRRCNIDVRRYDIIIGRSLLVNLGMSLYKKTGSFAINAVSFGDGLPVFVSLDKSKKPQRIRPQCLYTESKELPTGTGSDSEDTGSSIGSHSVLLDEDILGHDDFHNYIGARFEAVCTNREKVANNLSFHSFLKRKIGGYRVLLIAEIDCKDGTNSMQPPMNYIELKSRLETGKDEHYMMRYWLQSYLAGVPMIVEGVRDSKGKLLSYEKFETSKIPEIHRGGWCETRILDFLSFILKKIFEAAKKKSGTTVQSKFDGKNRQFTGKFISNHITRIWKRELCKLDAHMDSRKPLKTESAPVFLEQVHVQKDELQFEERGKGIVTCDSVMLQNKGDTCVTYKIKTTDKQSFAVRPNLRGIEAGRSVVVTIMYNGRRPKSSNPRFLLEIARIPEEPPFEPSLFWATCHREEVAKLVLNVEFYTCSAIEMNERDANGDENTVLNGNNNLGSLGSSLTSSTSKKVNG